jgi:hypothetical protein
LSEWKEAVVQISVPGRVRGPLGVCPHVGGWSVTHLPTGWAIQFTLYEAEAMEFADEIMDACDWGIVTPLNITSEAKDAVRTAREKFGLSRDDDNTTRSYAFLKRITPDV